MTLPSTSAIGKSHAEKKLESIQLCRDVVQRIMDLEPSQEQILMIVQFLSCEILDHSCMVDLVATTKAYLRGRDALLIPDDEGA